MVLHAIRHVVLLTSVTDRNNTEAQQQQHSPTILFGGQETLAHKSKYQQQPWQLQLQQLSLVGKSSWTWRRSSDRCGSSTPMATDHPDKLACWSYQWSVRV